MNHFFRLLNKLSSYFLLGALMLGTLSSCVISTTSAPYLPGQEAGPQEKVQNKKKDSKSIFTKKPRNAYEDFKKDNRKGRLKLKQYGAPSEITPYYNQLLTEDLGVEIEVIAGGVVSGPVYKYAKEYNAMMTREIERKYSPGILNVARRKAQIMAAQAQEGNTDKR